MGAYLVVKVRVVSVVVGRGPGSGIGGGSGVGGGGWHVGGGAPSPRVLSGRRHGHRTVPKLQIIITKSKTTISFFFASIQTTFIIDVLPVPERRGRVQERVGKEGGGRNAAAAGIAA